MRRYGTVKDELNIRKLYNDILEERVKANGHVILENVNIPSKGSNPDGIIFDGNKYGYEGGDAFAFIGQSLAFSENTHPYIFNAIKALYNNPKDKKILKNYGVKIFGSLGSDDVQYFIDNQKSESMGGTRINTRSGRIWKSLPSQSSKRNVSVVAFWCKQKLITEEYLKKLKECFGVKDLFWIGSDSKNYNYFGNVYQSGDIKEFRSKIAPELSHEDIVDILMRAHTGHRMTPFEKKIVWEFRGFDPSEIKSVTGGYPSVAEYEYRKKFSESVE